MAKKEIKKDKPKQKKLAKVLFTATVDSHILHFHLPYLKMFKDNGYEVHVATNGDVEIPYCDKKHIIPFDRSPFKINNIKAIKELKEIIDKEKFKIIHCHTPMGSVVTRIAAMKARKKGTRVIYTAHGFHFYKGAPLKNWVLFYPIEKWLSRYTDTLITINEEDYNLAKKKFHSKQIELVHGVGVDPDKFNFDMSEEEKESLRKEVGVNKKDFVMICVGEFNENKNQIMQIEAMKELIKEKQNIKLLLAGEGDNREFIEKKIKEYNLEQNVKLLGYRKDIPRLLKICNLLLSTSKREGLPVNVIEALMSGVPVIGTNCRGTRDLIKEDLNGFVVKIDDVYAMKESMQKVISEKTESNKIDVQQYTMNNISNLMKEVYIGKKKRLVLLRSTSAVNDSRASKEIKTMLKTGYDVKVLCWDRDGYAKKINFIETTDGKAELIKFDVKCDYGSGTKSLFKMLRFQMWLYKKLKQIPDYDIIHACDLDTGIVGRKIAKKNSKRLVYDIFDYYIDAHHIPHIAESIVEKQEIKVINDADITIICNDWRRDQIKKASPKKLIVIHNSPELSDKVLAKHSIIKSQTDKLKVVYVGILQENRLLKEIGELLKGNKNIELHIGGFGNLSEYFENLANNYDNVFFYGTLKYEDVLKLESECDLLFATYNPDIENHKYSAPNKLYEAMALSKQIIVCKNTGIDKFVIENKLGKVIDYNAEDFVKKVSTYLNNKVIENKKAKELYLDKYDWKVMEKLLLEAYINIAKKR